MKYGLQHIFCLVLTLATAIYPAQITAFESIDEIDPQRLIEAIDRNFWSATKYIEGRLIIDNGRRERTLAMETRMEAFVWRRRATIA